jgi:hypothetical protein
MKKEFFFGNRYDYIIVLTKIEKEYIFEILASYKKDKTKSTITNLNYILGELVESIIDKEPIDSWIVLLDKKKANKLFNKSVGFFHDKLFIHSLELHLDEDRDSGEWEAEFEYI